ncbi:unnamed protein product [Owenia fusiformis]|uniref:Uncharacterized protein n=1 Tax=Owenia fusiformis TaxID=6347 RepID=A0A8J1XU00_OWEFU|nr:unnamed protein product [Owenia fusiformis]
MGCSSTSLAWYTILFLSMAFSSAAPISEIKDGKDSPSEGDSFFAQAVQYKQRIFVEQEQTTKETTVKEKAKKKQKEDISGMDKTIFKKTATFPTMKMGGKKPIAKATKTVHRKKDLGIFDDNFDEYDDLGEYDDYLDGLNGKNIKTTTPKPKPSQNSNFEMLNDKGPVSHKQRHKGSKHSVKVDCEPTKVRKLSKMLGPAFNPRYMSIERPTAGFSGSAMTGVSGLGKARDTRGFMRDQPLIIKNISEATPHLPFRVSHDFKRDLPNEGKYTTDTNNAKPKNSDIPSVSHFLESIRTKRSTNNDQPWQCASRIVWFDLGDDHFPRFLRAAECVSDRCWFSHYKCVPRAFTVKVLRRSSDTCKPVSRKASNGPQRFEQEWVFEERAVTFCCDCAKS